MPVAEIYGGISAFKTMFDMAKSLKDMNDASVRNAAVIELQEKIFAAREAQLALLEHIRELEAQVAGFERWETEKQRYQMQHLQTGSIVYTLKPDAQPPEPPHKICAACYQHGKKAILQIMPQSNPSRHLWSPQEISMSGLQK